MSRRMCARRTLHVCGKHVWEVCPCTPQEYFGGVGTHLLSFRGGEDRGCQFPWTVSVRLMTWVNKVGGGPRFLSSAKMRSCRMPVSIDIDGVLFFEMLRLRTPLGTSCLEIVGSVGIRSYAPMLFYLTV
jgi:hypothetical protein